MSRNYEKQSDLTKKRFLDKAKKIRDLESKELDDIFEKSVSTPNFSTETKKSHKTDVTKI